MGLTGASFATHGPFKFSSLERSLDAVELRSFWRSLQPEELKDASGVYVFAVQLDKRLTPIYVGRAEKGFKERLKSNHDALRHALDKFRGKPLSVFFLVRNASPESEKFTRRRIAKEKSRPIRDLELLLIREFVEQGVELFNTQSAMYYKHLYVPGFIPRNAKPQTAGAKNFRKLIRSKHANDQATI